MTEVARGNEIGEGEGEDDEAGVETQLTTVDIPEHRSLGEPCLPWQWPWRQRLVQPRKRRRKGVRNRAVEPVRYLPAPVERAGSVLQISERC